MTRPTRKGMARCLLTGLLAVWTLTALVAAWPSESLARDTNRKQILLLNSYHQNFTWNERIFQGLSDVLRPRETGIILHVEYMDTKRVSFTKDYDQQLRDVYEHKYRNMHFDLIMVTDNNAFEFMRRHHDTLFPGVPVVFSGVNYFSPDMLDGHPLFTGVVESLNVRGTLRLALGLHPDTRLVYVITDHTPTGEAARHAVTTALEQQPFDVNITLSDAGKLDTLLNTVEKLPENALVLFCFYYRDENNHFYDVGEAIQAIKARTQVPVYGVVDYQLGHGIVGGLLSSAYSQGQSMAQLALHVLAGRSPKDVPVIMDGASRAMFDYTELKRFDIGMEELPEGSDIINRPKSFYMEHSPLIWLGMAFTAIQMVIIVFLVINTTRRRQAEMELRSTQATLEERVRERTGEVKETLEALRTVFDASQDAIFIHDSSGRILDVNERMLEIYGVRREELDDLSIARDISSRDNAVYRLSAIWRSVSNGEPQNFEWRARRPHSGREFDVEVFLKRIVYHGEEAILANVRDITVRKESENRIRQSLSKFEAILENSLMGIAMSRRRKFVTINQRGAEIFGYTPGQIIGSDVDFLFDSLSSLERFMAASRASLDKHGEFNQEQAFLHRNGRLVWCRMYAKSVDPGDLDKGVIWAWDDITEQRRAQQEIMRAREDAESANRAKSEFLAAMSHEIRTPMNAIVGMTEITLQTELNDNQREYLRTVMDSSHHLLNIINDILDLSKIEARKLELDRTDFDIPYLVRSTVKGLKIQASQKGLSLTLAVADDITACVKGDPLALRQILVNLVGNAIKFTHRGSVDIRVTAALPDPHKNEDDPRTIGIAFEVEDTGIGIPTEFMDTIFQSFSQTTRAFGGTGLGLAICKRLIGLMGGDICVESTVGSGSIFAFTAWFEPGVSCPIPAEERSILPEAPSSPVKVLVAEDNDVNVMVTTLRLDEMGYTYAVAKTGLEVLELLKREHFDLILMDIEMPVLDGIAATRAIRSAVIGGPIPNPNIPIIGVTAHALKEFREKSIDAGMDDYVSKPVDFHELAVIINRLMGGTVRPAPAEAPETPPEPPATPVTSNNGESAISSTPETDTLPLWLPEKAMEDLGVDAAIFEDFVQTARREMRTVMQELAQALGSGDVQTAQRLAHTVLSVCISIGAHGASILAADLETACRENKSTSSPLQALVDAVAELDDHIADTRGE